MQQPHEHAHGDRNGWFLDQLCTIAVTGGYAGVVTAMFLGKHFGAEDRSLINVIVPWIQYLLVFGALVLALLTALRAVAVWRASRLAGVPDDAHEPGDSHTHGWSPWKFIPLVIPLILFIGLGLPDDRMLLAFERDLAEGALAGMKTSGAGDSTAQVQITAAQVAAADQSGGLASALILAGLAPNAAAIDLEATAEGPPVATPDMGELEQIAANPAARDTYRQMWRVETEGVFHPRTQDATVFGVMRMRVACCLNDGSPVAMFCVAREPTPIRDGAWVAVQGRLDFEPHDGKWIPFMRVHKITKKKAPSSPHLR